MWRLLSAKYCGENTDWVEVGERVCYNSNNIMQELLRKQAERTDRDDGSKIAVWQ